MSTTDQNDLVLLKVMSFTANISSDFIAVGESDSGVLTGSRVRFLRSHSTDTGANTLLLRRSDITLLLVE
jgi:hypothetical protein